jgi:thiol-disulfide isomerase/thioredoxin
MDCPHCEKPAPDTNYKCPHCGGILKKGFSLLEMQPKQKQQKSMAATYIILFILVIGLAILGYFIIQQGNQKKGNDGERQTANLQNIDTDNKQPANTFDTIPDDSSVLSDETDPSELSAGDDQYSSGVNADQQYSGFDQSGDKGLDESSATDDNSYSSLPEMNIEDYTPGQEIDVKKLVHPGKMTIFDFSSEYCGPCKIISPKLEQLDNQREDIVVVKIDINRESVRGIDWNSPVSRQYNLRSIPHFIVYDEKGLRTHEGIPARQYVYKLLYEAGIR